MKQGYIRSPIVIPRRKSTAGFLALVRIFDSLAKVYECQTLCLENQVLRSLNPSMEGSSAGILIAGPYIVSLLAGS